MGWLVSKTAAMRIFDDENGVMNRSVVDVKCALVNDGPVTIIIDSKIRE